MRGPTWPDGCAAPTREPQQGKERAEKLLLNIMPRRVCEELKDYGTMTPQSFDRGCVLMLDVERLTEVAIARDPTALIAGSNDVFTSFDRIVEHLRGGGSGPSVTRTWRHQACPDPVRTTQRTWIESDSACADSSSAETRTRQRSGVAVPAGPVIGSIVSFQEHVCYVFGTA